MEMVIELGREQQSALDLIRGGDFSIATIMGKAGTGKSFVLRKIRETMRPIVLAPTGLAALNVEGVTIHSFFNLKPGSLEGQIGALDGVNAEVLHACSNIVFDEISMVRADLLDACDKICRMTLGKDEPFGGKKVVAFGDPFQLEPIVKAGDESNYLYSKYRSPFFFDANCYEDSTVIELSEVFRQTDPDFKEALNLCRIGDRSGTSYINRKATGERTWNDLTICLTNQAVAYINQESLAQIPGDVVTFVASTYGSFYQDTPADSVLHLKVGARVMCLANSDETVNGDLGVITRFVDGFPIVMLDRGYEVSFKRKRWEKLKYVYNEELDALTSEIVGEFSQIPLRLAWAITGHKSQGQTYEKAYLLFDRNPWAHGQTYVMLSRCKSIEGLGISRLINQRDLIVNRRVLDWHASV